jgi:hypothetical protein
MLAAVVSCDQDCLKALKMPSLLRSGSRQFITFIDAIQVCIAWLPVLPPWFVAYDRLQQMLIRFQA